MGTNSFAQRVIEKWNNLPSNVVNARDTNEFKNRLDYYWKNEEVLYDFEATLKIYEKDGRGELEDASSNDESGA